MCFTLKLPRSCRVRNGLSKFFYELHRMLVNIFREISLTDDLPSEFYELRLSHLRTCILRLFFNIKISRLTRFLVFRSFM